jgi:PKD repeat protein
MADFALDGQVAKKGQQARLDASASADPDGRIVQYEWDFGDGTVGAVSHSPLVVHVFAHAGSKNVTLTVIDDKGAGGTVSHVVEVTNELPIADLGLSRDVVLTGIPVVLDATGSQDSDGTVVSYEFSVSKGTGQPVVVYSGDSPTAEYVPTEDGLYNVTVTVRDDDGGLASRTATLEVLDRPPVAFLDAATLALDGKVLNAPASAPVSVEATDPDGTIGSVKVLINGVLDSEHTGDLPYTITLHFFEEARIALSVVVVDDDGSSVTLGVNFTVNEVPVARFGLTVGGHPATAADTRTGSAIRFNATNSSDAAGSRLTYVWDFGDGPQLEGPVVDHAYLLAGTYTVTLTVKDAYGAQGVARLDLVVVKAQGDWQLVAWIGGLMAVALILVGFVFVRSRRGGGDDAEGGS